MTNKINEDIKKLVIARLESMPSYIEVNMGDYGVCDKEDLISAINQETELGKKIIEMQMSYLKDLKNL